MSDQFQFQPDNLMQQFSKIKNEYLELKSANKNLEEAIELLKQRLIKKEQQKHNLITMFKKIISQNQVKIQSMQKENNHLQITVHEQNQTLDEYSNIIDELKKKVELVTENNTETNNDKQIYNNFPTAIQNRNDKVDIVKIKSDKNINSTNFTHPSFNTEATITNKSQKKARVCSHFRWPNLDIMVSEGNKIETSTSHINITPEKESKLPRFEKRRKLYCPDDGTVDLENEEN